MEKNSEEFFRENTLRICGSLDIDKALYRCFLSLGRFIPVTRIKLELYQTEFCSLQRIAFADEKGGKKLDMALPLPDEARPIIEYQLVEQRRDVKIINDMESDPFGRILMETFDESKNISRMVMHLNIEDKRIGIVVIEADGRDKYTKSHAKLLAELREPFAVAMSNAIRYTELVKLKDLIADHSEYLHKELMKISGDEIIGLDSGLKGVKEQIRQVAPLETPVMLIGETGVGKEVIANAIQQLSPRKGGPFIKVNCGGIPVNLVDSELFGHEKGAYTGAIALKRGRFERANHGTIFLDEISELPLEIQVKLLRVLQFKNIERVGGTKTISLDIRIIAATNVDPEKLIESGKLREDLFFRLNVFPITIPPLRERKQDIPALVDHFISQKSAELKIRPTPDIPGRALEELMTYDWPGNVRELANIVERALIQNKGGSLNFSSLFLHLKKRGRGKNHISEQPRESYNLESLDDVISQHIQKVLRSTDGKIKGKNGAAEILEMNSGTLRSRMDKLGIPYKSNKIKKNNKNLSDNS